MPTRQNRLEDTVARGPRAAPADLRGQPLAEACFNVPTTMWRPAELSRSNEATLLVTFEPGRIFPLMGCVALRMLLVVVYG